jgi:hypothetical protein
MVIRPRSRFDPLAIHREIDINPLLMQALKCHLVFGHRGALPRLSGIGAQKLTGDPRRPPIAAQLALSWIDWDYKNVQQ